MILIIALEKDITGDPMIGGIYSNNDGDVKCYAFDIAYGVPPEPVDITTSLSDFREVASGVEVYSVSTAETLDWCLCDKTLREHLVDLALQAAIDEGFVTDPDVATFRVELEEGQYHCYLGYTE